MNKSLRARGRESSRKTYYGFQRGDVNAQKKSRRFRRLLKLITGRRQTEWTGATRCPKEDNLSHIRESLIDRKRTIFFRLRLPCRPLAEWRREYLNTSPRRTPGPIRRGGSDEERCLTPLLKMRGHGVSVPAQGRDDGITI